MKRSFDLSFEFFEGNVFLDTLLSEFGNVVSEGFDPFLTVGFSCSDGFSFFD